MKKKVGRPRTGLKRNKTFSIAVTEEERKKINEKLKVEGRKKIDVFLEMMKIKEAK